MSLEKSDSISELDSLVTEFSQAWDDYEAKKIISSEAHKKASDIEARLMDSLKSAGKPKYFVDGIGTVTRVERTVFKVPNNPENKLALFNYISEKFGDQVLTGLLSINHNSLNSFFKDVAESPPGLDAPTSQTYLKLTRG